MRVSYLLSFAVALVTPGICQAGVFSKTPVESDSPTIRETFLQERRYLLYNSRALSGECLDICVDDRGDPPVGGATSRPTASPSTSPTSSPSTSPTTSPSSGPTASPTKSPSSGPTASPTESPTESPSSGPTASPTESPTASPSTSPTESPSATPVATEPTPRLECECEANDYDVQQSWKCGNDIYVCPGIEEICATQDSKSKKAKYYAITEAECDAMREVEIGKKCLTLPRYGLNHAKALSNRACYTYIDGVLTAYKVDAILTEYNADSRCDQCSTKPIRFEPVTNP